jgi:chromosome segregation ATPase
MTAGCPMVEEVEMVEPQADEANQSEHLWVSCPKCQRANLRIRRALLGQRVLCKHCGEHFHARTAHDPSANASFTQVILPAPPFSATARADENRAAVLENTLEQLRGELALRVAERGAAHRELKQTQDLLAQLRRRFEDLEQQLDRAQEQLRHASALRDGLEEAPSRHDRLGAGAEESCSPSADDARRADPERMAALENALEQARALHDELGVVRLENARLRAAVAQLGSQVADRVRREDELWSELQANQIHLQETGAQCARSDPGSIEAKARELEELRTERDRLAAGQQGWQAQLDAARLQLEQELQTAQQEIEPLQHQLESLGRERDTTLERVEALARERDAELERVKSVGRERDAALEQVKSLGRKRDAALRQLDSLVQERDRLAAVQADDSQRHAKSLEALRHDLELARSLAGSMRENAKSAESARAVLEYRLVEVEDRLRAAIETSNRLDSEARAARAQLALLQRATDQRQAFAGDLEAARLRMEQLAVELRQTNAANENLRALLGVFGLVDHLESGFDPAALRAAPISHR